MRLQQVISGAANDKANAVVVGRIRGIPVLVCYLKKMLIFFMPES
jgi:hypothetical protein